MNSASRSSCAVARPRRRAQAWAAARTLRTWYRRGRCGHGHARRALAEFGPFVRRLTVRRGGLTSTLSLDPAAGLSSALAND